jgi:hypothetical protein
VASAGYGNLGKQPACRSGMLCRQGQWRAASSQACEICAEGMPPQPALGRIRQCLGLLTSPAAAANQAQRPVDRVARDDTEKSLGPPLRGPRVCRIWWNRAAPFISCAFEIAVSFSCWTITQASHLFLSLTPLHTHTHTHTYTHVKMGGRFSLGPAGIRPLGTQCTDMMCLQPSTDSPSWAARSPAARLPAAGPSSSRRTPMM